MRGILFSLFFVSFLLGTSPEEITYLLKSKKVKDRWNGLNLLEKVEDKEIRLKLLIPLLSDAKKKLRRKALDILGRIKEEEIIPYLDKVRREEKDWHLRYQAIKYLVQFTTSAVHPLLLDSLRNDPELKIRALVFKSVSGDGLKESALEIALEDRDKRMREEALEQLKRLVDSSKLRLLSSFFEKERDKRLREKGLDILKDIKRREVIPLLVKILREDESSSLRKKAIEILYQLPFPEALPALAKGVKDEEMDIRLFTLSLLAKKGDKRVIGALKVALKDKKEKVRLYALYTLGLISRMYPPPSPALGGLLMALKDEEEKIVLVALDIIKLFPEERIVPALEELFERRNSKRIRKKIVNCLVATRSQTALPLLFRILHSTPYKEEKEEIERAILELITPLSK